MTHKEIIDMITALTKAVEANKGLFGSESLMDEANDKIREIIKKKSNQMKIYKNYEFNEIPNEYGYYEAVNIVDCDATIIIGKTINKLKSEIDEYNLNLEEKAKANND